jgi:hypothetical protein
LNDNDNPETGQDNAIGSAVPDVDGLSPDATAVFISPLQAPKITIWDLIHGTLYGSAALGASSRKQAIAATYFPALLTAFQSQEPKTKFVIQEGAGLAAALKDEELDIYVLRNTLAFDWTAPRVLTFEIEEIAEETSRWIPSKAERSGLLNLLFGIATEVQTAIVRENLKHVGKDGGDMRVPGHGLEQDLAVLRPRIGAARLKFEREAQRAAQAIYAAGMGCGTIALWFLCGILGWILGEEHLRLIYGVGLLAGGLGAVASVLQRMRRNLLEVNFQTDTRLMLSFGAVRPLLGGLFGMVVFCIIRAELVAPFKLPTDAGAAVAYVAVFAFLAGFNERFFRDVLAGASQGYSEDPAPGVETTATGEDGA